MKIAYFQCFAGISGDMILGALIDAGLDIEKWQADLAKLPLSGYQLRIEKVKKQGLSATKVHVVIEEEHAHRNLQDITKIINESTLPVVVKERSIQVFTRLADAEAKVHQSTLDHIHFHEVGAKDAIIDIVGAVIGLWHLGIEKVYSSAIHTGTGFTRSAHGTIPIPVPAVLELLKDCPIYSQGIEKELVTPTGAAILTTYCQKFGNMPHMKISNTGYGAGERDLEIPNLLRISLGVKREAGSHGSTRFDASSAVHQGQATMIEANIDDMNPEFYNYLITKFLKDGAMDVFLQTIQMKKNRPAIILNLLVHDHQVEEFCQQIFAETTSIGVRTYPVTKYMLRYEIITVETQFGPVPVKIARSKNVVQNVAPEYEDCCKLAEQHNKPLKVIYDLVKQETYQLLNDQ